MRRFSEVCYIRMSRQDLAILHRFLRQQPTLSLSLSFCQLNIGITRRHTHSRDLFANLFIIAAAPYRSIRVDGIAAETAAAAANSKMMSEILNSHFYYISVNIASAPLNYAAHGVVFTRREKGSRASILQIPASQPPRRLHSLYED